MKEPTVLFPDHGVEIPYSQMPVSWMQEGLRSDANFQAAGREDYDPDFRRRYLAILLRERGQ